MAESYSVKAILSAVDKGFSSTLGKCAGTLDKIDKKISGFSFGILTGAGQAAFNTVTSSIGDMVGEIDSSNVAWKTFEGNMKNFGKSSKEIDNVTSSLQRYAETTVYSSSDMAQTYAQLEAVGVGGMKSLEKGTEGLVKGFGGLAAAAENPQQAMKSLSQQATQMAAKPKVAWEDFKIMLEQSPAGIAAVAKEMGISTEKLIKKIQAGEVSTESFFAAVEAAGNSKGFQDMATKAKSVGMAMDGMKETLANKLLPAFNILSEKGIAAINGIADKLSKIDGEALAAKVTAGLEKAQPYWEAFKEVLAEVGGVLKKLGAFLADNADTIAKAIPTVLKLAAGYKAFKVVQSVAPGMMKFASSITSLASKGIGMIAGKLFGIAGAEKAAGTAAQSSASQTMAAAKAFMMMGAAVLMISGGIALLALSAISLANAGPIAIGVMAGLVLALVGLGVGMAVLLKTLAPMSAQLMPVATAMLALGAAVVLVAAGFGLLTISAIALANAGPLAIGIMVGLVAAIALLAIGAAALGPALTAGAVGFVAFGAAIALVGVGALLAAAALAVISLVLPAICAYGTQGALAIAALGAGMIVFAAGAALAGAAAVILGAGLIVVGAGLLVVGAGALVAAVGILMMSAASSLLSVSLLASSTALLMMSAAMLLASAGGLVLAAAFTVLVASSLLLSGTFIVLTGSMAALAIAAAAAAIGIGAFGIAMTASAIGVVAMAAALKGVNSSMKTIASNAKKTEKSLSSMQDSVNAVESGLSALGDKAKSAMNKLSNAFDDAAKDAKKAGKEAGDGFATGMQSGLTKAPVVAMTAVAATNAALASGRSSAYQSGAYISQGFAQGMLSQLATIRSAATQMAAAAEAAIRAKAKIASPSKVTDKLGQWFGEGFANGISDMVGTVQAAAEDLVSIPQIASPKLALAYGGEMSSDYDYYRETEYTFSIPVEVDGREVAKATATYTQDELDRMQAREERKHGRR
jgi:tape measure domain-containing protein